MDSNAPQPPANIGRFRVDAVLGSGGMGAVYKAFDPTLQRIVAVKTVRPDIASPDFIERLIREAQACARLKHPNIVTVHEAGQIDGMVYIVMEYLQGEDLGAALKRGALTFEDKIRTLVQVLDALQHSHAEGVIHRDIKPSNVHRQADGSIKLVDFGLARVEAAEPLTRSGTLMCTPEYASPEQLRGETLDGRTDVYSVGVLAYEMVAGRRPFIGETFGSVIAKVLADPVPAMNVSWSRELPEIERIFGKALEKSAANRYQSAAAMKSDLTAFLNMSNEAIARAELRFAQAVYANGDSATIVRTPASGGTASDTTPSTATHVSGDSSPTTTTGTTGTTGATAEAPPRPASSAGAPRSWAWPAAVGAAAVAAFVVAALVMSSRTAPSPEPASPTSAGVSGSVQAPTGGNATAAPVIAGAAGTGTSDVQSAPASAGNVSPAPPAAPGRTAQNPSPDAPTARTPDAAAMGTAPAGARSTGAATPYALRSPTRAPSAKEIFASAAGGPGDTVNTGLRYRLTRRAQDGTISDVDPATTTFRSGDRVRFAFESNIDAFLYVVQQGSSGRWTLLFPGPRINGGLNAVKKSDEYVVPSNDWFLFDATPGTEHVFVLLSKDPLSELPGFDRPVTRTESVVASVVDDLQRRVQSRDLLLESDAAPTVEDGTPVQATYVVSRAQQGQSVAASITLTHTQ